MQDEIKDVLSRINDLESAGSEDRGSALQLGELYGRMKKLGMEWSPRLKKWIPIGGEENADRP